MRSDSQVNFLRFVSWVLVKYDLRDGKLIDKVSGLEVTDATHSNLSAPSAPVTPPPRAINPMDDTDGDEDAMTGPGRLMDALGVMTIVEDESYIEAARRLTALPPSSQNTRMAQLLNAGWNLRQ